MPRPTRAPLRSTLQFVLRHSGAVARGAACSIPQLQGGGHQGRLCLKQDSQFVCLFCCPDHCCAPAATGGVGQRGTGEGCRQRRRGRRRGRAEGARMLLGMSTSDRHHVTMTSGAQSDDQIRLASWSISAGSAIGDLNIRHSVCHAPVGHDACALVQSGQSDCL